MKPINVSIIGYGMSGQYFHLPPLLLNGDYHVKSVMTNNPDNIRLLSSNHPDLTIIQTFEQAVNDQDVDLIIIATPNDVHASYTTRALEAGKHVVVEKPFVETYQEASDLFALARKHQRVLRVFHNRQYDGDILTVHDVVKSGKLGTIVAFHARFDTFQPHVSHNWRDHEGVMPGVFYDLAPHLLDHALRLFGLPESLYARSFIDRPGGTVDDHFEMMLYDHDGLLVTLGAHKLDRHPRPRFELIGTEATYVKHGFDHPDVLHEASQDTHHPLSDRSQIIFGSHPFQTEQVPLRLGSHYLFFERLADDIRHPKADDPDKTYALQVVKLMELAQSSMKTKKEIIVNM
ncbi:MAG: hypothetical protein EA375_00240 [Acholeplasmataceae bacterium]|nr:MAG: hypothetical protein EA375_00240 [Acholeplasmataceae bacterium]